MEGLIDCYILMESAWGIEERGNTQIWRETRELMIKKIGWEYYLGELVIEEKDRGDAEFRGRDAVHGGT